jgi:hypothetical protein
MVSIGVDWVIVEEAPIFSFEMLPSAVVEKNRTPKRPDIIEPFG